MNEVSTANTTPLATEKSNIKPPLLLRVVEFCHDHTTLMKVIAVSAIILGAAAIVTLPLSLPVLAGGAIALAVVGGVIAIIASIALIKFNMSFAAHKMNFHAFKEVPQGIHPQGFLTYSGNLPMLTITTSDPFEAGKIQGLLLGEQIHGLRARFSSAGALKKPEEIPHILKKLNGLLDENYKKELQGLASGFNEWAKKQLLPPKEITADEVLAFHLIPDSIHFKFKAAEKICRLESGTVEIGTIEKPVMTPACTSVLDRDEEQGIIFGRNMDWMSLGISGTYSLLIRRTTPQGIQTVDVTVPGMIGSITAMNNTGLSLAMNVCPGCTVDIEGIPAVFLNRRIAERCKTVSDIQKHIDETKPLGSYHLTAADKDGNAHVFRMKQKLQSKKTGFPRWVTNFNKDWRTLFLSNVNPEWGGYYKRAFGDGNMFASRERNRLLKEHFSRSITPKYNIETRVRSALKLPFVNNAITTHSVIMRPKIGSMSVAFDNGYAAKVPLQTLTREQLFTTV